MPDTRSPDHARLILEFVGAVRKHLVAFITSSIIAALLWWSQGVGWLAPRHWVVWCVAVLGLLISVYQAWVDERLRVGALVEQLNDKTVEGKVELRRAELVLHSRGDSTYIALGRVPKEIYIELDLAIENKGNRTSNVVGFRLDAAGTHFSELKPAYPRSIQGRRTGWGLAGTGLAMDGHITVEAEKMVSGKLAFFVPFVPTGNYGDLYSSLDSFHGTLTITDTEGVSASHDFIVAER
jgi:hypothetical protein